MSDEKRVLVRWGNLKVQQDEISARKDPFRTELRAGIPEPVEGNVDVPEDLEDPGMDARQAEGVEHIQANMGVSAQEALGKVIEANGDVSAYVESGLDPARFQEGQTTASWIAEADRQLGLQSVKAEKQGNITPAAAVIESGQPAPSSAAEYESLQEELQAFQSGERGSIANPENRKRMKEISAKLDRINPPVQI